MKSIINFINESDYESIRQQANDMYNKYLQARREGNSYLAKKYKTKMVQLSAKADKIEFGGKEVINILKKLGYSPAKSSGTAIRGYRNYDKGYEYNSNNYTYITLHLFNDDDIEKITNALKDNQYVDKISKEGISLKKK